MQDGGVWENGCSITDTIYRQHWEYESLPIYVERMNIFVSANNLICRLRTLSLLKLIIPLTAFEFEAYYTSTNLTLTESWSRICSKGIGGLFQSTFLTYNSVEGYKLSTRYQTAGETVCGYFPVLKDVARHCKPGKFPSLSLQDRFVWNLSNLQIWSKFWSKLKQACKLHSQWKSCQHMLRKLISH